MVFFEWFLHCFCYLFSGFCFNVFVVIRLYFVLRRYEFLFCNSIPIVLLLISFWFTLWYIPLAHKTKTACDGSINLVIGGFA